ncbi:MAG: hypothetical protein O2973_10255 [Gemmatimonadetes bacterium]|nr:hypothetical protein [Gemmatimonadota bacterium]
MARKIACNAGLAALIIAGSASLAAAQPRMVRGPNPDAPRLMVSACQAPDKALATACADAIRSEVEGSVSFRNLVVISKSDVETTLSASGYDPAISLASGDAIALAKQLRADFYVDGVVERGGAGYKMTAWAVLARNANMREPLGIFEHARIETIADQVSKSFRDIFTKTYENQSNCFSLERERKYDDAMKEMDNGLKKLPESMWLRHCKLALLKDKRAPGAEVSALLEEIVKVDAGNKSALRDLVVIYDTDGNRAKKLETLEALHRADPTDSRLTADVVNEYAAMGQFDKARPIAEKAVAENPGDINVVRPYWLIVMTLKEYKLALEVGMKMATMDTSTADTSFFYKMIGAANADSNWTVAAQLSDQASAKYPTVPDFPVYASSFYRKAGDIAASVAAAQRALKANPKLKDLRASVAAALLGESPPKADEAIVVAKEMVANEEDKDQIASIAVGAGNSLRVWVDTLKARGANAGALQAAAERAYNALAWADTLAMGTTLETQAKFVLGVAALTVGQGYLTTAGDAPNKVIAEIRAMKPIPPTERQNAMLAPAYAEGCALVKKANSYLTIAQTAVPAGGRSNPAAAQQVMGSLMQLNGYVDQLTKAYCK